MNSSGLRTGLRRGRRYQNTDVHLILIRGAIRYVVRIRTHDGPKNDESISRCVHTMFDSQHYYYYQYVLPNRL